MGVTTKGSQDFCKNDKGFAASNDEVRDLDDVCIPTKPYFGYPIHSHRGGKEVLRTLSLTNAELVSFMRNEKMTGGPGQYC